MVALGVLFLFCLSRFARSDRHLGDSTTSNGIGNRSVLLCSLFRLQLLCSSGVSSLSASGNEFRSFKIGEQVLAHLLHNVTECKVGDHDKRQLHTELWRKYISDCFGC